MFCIRDLFEARGSGVNVWVVRDFEVTFSGLDGFWYGLLDSEDYWCDLCGS